MEKPIIFSTEMVRSILEGRKTQTRRVIKPQPIIQPDRTISHGRPQVIYPDWDSFIKARCPYGQPGDILWVRETWAYEPPTYCFETSVSIPVQPGYYVYRADYQQSDLELVKWRPSIHMPREAARLFLDVKNVRVERVQDITEEDAKAEGATPQIWYQPYGTKTEGEQRYLGDLVHQKINYRTGFADIWDKINGPRGYSWDKNPWVWVIEFEVAYSKD